MTQNKQPKGFFREIFDDLMKFATRLIVAFLLGTAVGAVVCLIYGIPIGFSIIGGLIVVGIAVALMSASSLF